MKINLTKKIVKRLLAPFSNSLLVNNGAYWDRYVLYQKISGAAQSEGIVGREWKGEKEFLKLLKKYSKNRPFALEMGCGAGRITIEAIPLFRNLYATDVSKRMLQECRKNVGERPSVKLFQTDGFSLKEFQDQTFDIVFSHDVFVHFSSLQVYPYLKEIRRVLKPRGIALISFYNFLKHFALFREMATNYNENKQFPPHMRVHFITEEMIRTMSSDLGLRIVQVDRKNFLILAIEPA